MFSNNHGGEVKLVFLLSIYNESIQSEWHKYVVQLILNYSIYECLFLLDSDYLECTVFPFVFAFCVRSLLYNQSVKLSRQSNMGSLGYKVPDGKYSNKLISERAFDQPRPLKVIYIGAGISGICASIMFPKYVPTVDLVVYEKNADVGGTWFENR